MIDPLAYPDPENNGQTETELGPTSSKGGRPTRQIPEPPKWTVQGMEAETRRVIEKAAERTGKTLGHFSTMSYERLLQTYSKNGNRSPARPEDLVSEQFEQMKAELKQSQACELQSIRG